MGIRKHLAGLVGALLVTTGATCAAHAEPLRLRYSIWVGYGPLFVAVEKGFFAKEGVEVELIKIEDDTATLAALFAGQIDALATATQVVVSSNEPDEEALACGLMLDDSQGGDGILATKDIQTIADLKGKTVAFGHRSVSQFYINVLLREVSLGEADIEVVDLRSDAAAEAFMMREVDAAVTWEPYLSQGRNVAHGHLLTDSSERPGLIGDCLATKASIFNDRKQEFRAVARAWDAAVRYVEAQQPGQIYQTMQYAIDVWTDLGVLTTALTPASVIAHGILDQ
jgi:NitT/TauT family transport system substrate-binding protein